MPISSLSAAVDRLRSSPASQGNIGLILEHDKKLAGDRISDEHRKKFLDRLRWWAEFLGKDFRQAAKEDLEAGYNAIKARKDLKPGTINFYITMVRQFYKWLAGLRDDGGYIQPAPRCGKGNREHPCATARRKLPCMTRHPGASHPALCQNRQNQLRVRKSPFYAVMPRAGATLGALFKSSAPIMGRWNRGRGKRRQS